MLANFAFARLSPRLFRTWSEFPRLPGVKPYSGMPVEAVTLTGERTVLVYLARPLLDSFAHASKQQ
jgi:hypothetical protein